MEEKKFLGRWQSGRVWKTPAERSSKKNISRGCSVKTWKQKEEERRLVLLERARIKEVELERKEQKERTKQKLQEKRRRKEENTRKSEVTQVISNPRKLKRMPKAQRKALKIK